MSDLQLYLLEAEKNKSEATRIAGASALKIQSKELKLLDLVQSLGEYLNSDDGAIRAKTISYLAEVLQALPPKVLSGQQRTLLTDFCLSRISDDNEGIASCAKALLALERLGQWDSARVQKVMITLIEHTNPLIQYKLQSERYPILLLIDLLLSNYRDAVHKVHQASDDFLPRFIAYFDGEKDPRNLMIIFSILRVVGTEWDVSATAQDLFEASFNYFPITFRPPPDDPYGITAQDLKDRLKLCISASPFFSPYAFPALLDKLDSTSINVKRDTLQAMFSCIQEYGPQTVNLYSVTLWDTLKFEVLSVQEEDLAVESLKVLGEIGRQLSKSSKDALAVYLKPVAKECNEHLEDAPTKQSQGATRMLMAIASASASACNSLVKSILPHLFQVYQGTRDMAKKRALVESLGQLIRADIAVFGAWRQDSSAVFDGTASPGLSDSGINALTDFAGQTLELLSAALSAAAISQVSYRLVLTDALLQLAKVRSLLRDDQISQIISVFDDIVIEEDAYGKDEVKTAAINALVEIAHQKPELVINKSFPDFLGRLPDKDQDDQGPETFVPILEAFAKLAGEEKVFGTVVLRLKNKLSAAMQEGASPTYVHAIISALLYAFVEEESRTVSSSAFTSALPEVAHPLIKTVCFNATEEQQDDATFYLAGRLINVILRNQETDMQLSYAQVAYVLDFEDSDDDTPVLAKNLNALRNRRIMLSTYILAALRKEVTFPFGMTTVLGRLVDFASQSDLTPGVRLASLQHISLVINKFIPTSGIRTAIAPFLHEPQNLLSSESIAPSSIAIVFSILKALVLRNAPGLSETFASLIASLSNPQHGLAVARGFATLLQPSDIITKANHCTISPLHKQKTFSTLVPPLTTRFQDAESQGKKNYLIALAGIIRWVPYTVLESQLTNLLPLLLQTLDISDEDDVKSGTIDILTLILSESPAVIAEHVNALISRLLNCGTGQGSKPDVRARAMKCLSLVVVHLRTELVIPYRRQVVKRLSAVLDDRSRAVRSEAVRCRSKWIELDEAGDDDE